MRVTLVSEHSEWLEVASDMPHISFHEATFANLHRASEMFIWDFDPSIDLPKLIEERKSSQHLVLVEAEYVKSLAAVRRSACLLLKPIGALTLRSFIELSFDTWKTHQQEADRLRFDRDALLQYVLEVNLKLQEYDRERSDFLARALHDIRSPLTALQGYCELLSGEYLGPMNTAQHELVSRMTYSSRRLTRLAEGTLTLLLKGKLERPINIRESEVGQTLKRALHDVAPLLDERELKVRVDLSPPRSTLRYGKEEIQQVLINLLENSCKFTPHQGEIYVAGRDVQANGIEVDAYQIDVIDSGPGILPELAERIFDEYVTYSGSSDRSGGGLGLAICRNIISAHGGRIWACPSRDGGHFCFQLPYRLMQDPEASLDQESKEMVLNRAGL